MIYITQWLCPKRHCSIAFFWDDEATTTEDIAQDGEGYYERGLVRRVCGVCRSTKLEMEHRSTTFKTFDEALPIVKQTQAANILARVFIDTRRSYDEPEDRYVGP